ncbi:MAG TPA: AMP-binding protein, partial [Sandaracinaceae bacterium LLY-WYZ-13_1]|nr:AMP-binding protein [Sandaracinaceae bacterium LLY-WYZ-13_1]
DPAADDPAADDPAYVIFTSGSTGRPKGVVVTHRNLVHENDARRAVYGPPRGPTLSAHAFAFDAAAACTYWALTGGGALVLLDADERRDPAVLRARIAEHGVRTLDVPPALYRLLLDGDPSPLRSLRTVIVGGEAVSPSLARTHRARLGDARLFDEYGPTETTVFSTVHEVGGGDADGSGDAIPIGRPIHRTRARICDAAGRLVVRGAMGELWLAGAGVSAGYLRRPEQTAAAFVEHPALGRTYRTGDRARWDGGGRLAFLGREDAQIQVQGHRVELREVEAALEALAGVARAAVVPRRTDGETRLHAYLVPLADAELKPSALRDALRSTLPAPMRPSTFTRIDALPLGPSGKVDVARLPPPSPIPEAPVSHWRHEPRTQAEDVLARAFRDALGTAPASVHDSFFDLGGTSLSAVRVLAALHRELGVRVPLSAFVRAPSIAGLADRLHREELLDEEPLVVVVHEGRDRPPFWLVHPVGGHVVFAERIAARWSPDQPLYGIQARGLDGRRPPIRDMDTMADLYVRLIRRAQPTGPYFVGGPSQGGLVALEIAQRLRAQGETVGMLAMLDCWAPGWEPRRVGPVRHVLDHLDALRDLSWRERLEYLQARWRRRLDRMQSEWMEYRIGDEADRGPIYDTLREVERANEELADAYTPRPYPGRIHLFRAVKVPRSPGLRFDDPTLGWSRWAKGGVVVVEIDSAHHTMLDEPGVDLVARQLEHHLRRAQARAAGDQ